MIGLKLPTEREIAVAHDRRGELVNVEGIGEAVAERLRDRGYSSPEDLEGVAREELLEIEGISTNRADRILADLGGARWFLMPSRNGDSPPKQSLTELI